MTSTQDTAPDTLVTVPIFALLGFEQHPDDDQNVEKLLANFDGVVYYLEEHHLPIGGWANQGLCERVVQLNVVAGTYEATSAANNSAIWLRDNGEPPI